jgi:rRNA-processing protein FCF1
MPLLLISDSNILIDIEVGGLTASMFSLEYDFAVPDILYADELEGHHGHLIDMGLHIRPMGADVIGRVVELAEEYSKPSRNDLFALALAEYENCPLLTGDRYLRDAATEEGVSVNGTIWLIEQMVRQGKITIEVAEQAYETMKNNNRRLPWDLVDQSLQELR